MFKFINLLDATKIVNTNKTIKTKVIIQNFNKLLIKIKLNFCLIKVITIVIIQN